MSTPPTVPFAVKALFEYKSDYDDDLSFVAGQVITVTVIEDDEWYLGTVDGRSGMFPKNFVEILEPKVPHRPNRTQSNARDTDAAHDSQIDTLLSAVENVKDPKDAVESASKNDSEPTPKEVADSAPNDDVVSPHTDTISPAASKSETISPTQARVPLPQGSFPGQKIKDPYAIKKQFVGAKSSYVPKITPRDDANIVSHVHNTKHAVDPDIVRLSEPQSAEEPEEPKLSLKERIALLQKRQQEEQEREAAALAKQEEREAAALAKKDDKIKRSNTNEFHGPSVVSDADNENADTTEDTQSIEDMPHNDSDAMPSKLADEQVDSDSESAEQPQQDSDDEDMKRRKLVERMAKISGGRNMFGMMGMPTPFGAPSPATKTQKVSVSSEKGANDKVSSDKGASEDEYSTSAPSRKSSTKSTAKNVAEQGEEDSSKDDSTAVSSAPKKSDIATHAPSVPGMSAPLVPEEHGPSAPTTHAPSVPAIDPPSVSALHTERDDSPLPLISNAPEIPIPQIPSSVPAEKLPHTLDFSDAASGDEEEQLSAIAAAAFGRPPAVIPPVVPSETRDVLRGPPPVPHSLRAPKSGIPDETLYDEGDVTLGNSISSSSPLRVSGPVLELISRDAPPPVPSLSPRLSRSYAKPPPPPRVLGVPLEAPPFLELSTRSNTNLSPVKPPVPSMPPPLATQITPSPPPSFSSPTLAAPPVPSLPAMPPPLSRTLGEYDSLTEETEDEDEGELDATPEPVASYPSPVERSRTSEFPNQSLLQPKKASVRRTSTDSHHYKTLSRESTHSGPRQSTDTSHSRTKSVSAKHGGLTLADLAIAAVDADLTEELVHSDWWLKEELPPALASQNGSDLTYEVASSNVTKRCNRTLCYRDYYVLFSDLSQLIIELIYNVNDPRTSVKLISCFTLPVPTLNRELLDKYHEQFGSHISEKASSLTGSRIVNGVTAAALESLKNTQVLKRIGNQSFGIVIYENSNHNVTRNIDDLRPGDILWIHQAKFAAHNLIGSKSTVVGENEPYTAIITEADPKKEKWKVVELDTNGKTKAGSYKAADLKRGTIKVFRAVDRSHIGW